MLCDSLSPSASTSCSNHRIGVGRAGLGGFLSEGRSSLPERTGDCSGIRSVVRFEGDRQTQASPHRRVSPRLACGTRTFKGNSAWRRGEINRRGKLVGEQSHHLSVNRTMKPSLNRHAIPSASSVTLPTVFRILPSAGDMHTRSKLPQDRDRFGQWPRQQLP